MNQSAGSTVRKTLLVGVSNPATAGRLVRLSSMVGGQGSWELLLAHVVTVASQISLTTGQSSTDVVRARDFLEKVMADAEVTGVRARALVEVARDVAEGLLAAAESHGADMILVGYSEESAEPGDKRAEDDFDRTMHRVARKADADVVVAKFRGDGMDRILVPLAPEPPLLVTGALCRALGALPGVTMTFLHVVAADADLDDARRRVAERLEARGVAPLGDLVVREADDPVQAIVEEARSYDLVIVGPSDRPSFLDTMFSTRSAKIADEVPASVLMAWNRRSEG